MLYSKLKLGAWDDWTKMKISNLHGTTRIVLWSLADPWYSNEQCTFQHTKPVLFPSSVLHEWLISTNDNTLNCSKTILQHTITVGKHGKNYPLFKTNYFTLLKWKKSKSPVFFAAERSLQPIRDSSHIRYLIQAPECAELKRRRHISQSFWGVGMMSSTPFTDNGWEAIVKVGNREGADDIDLKGHLKIFTIFNSYPLCQLSLIFYCKVNCLPNGPCEYLGSRNNLSRNWCSCSSAGTTVLWIHKRHS